MDIREGTAADTERIAALHTRSWRTAYAEIFPADYLDGPVEAQQAAMWHERLVNGAKGELLVADDGTAIAGFAYLIPEDGRVLLDNLHVDPRLKRSGIGGVLLRHALDRAAGQELYLEVLKENRPAVAFYERHGGTRAREFVERFPEGFEVDVLEYYWSGMRSDTVPRRSSQAS
ncbi:GNAT family N-acetyltransferase [Nonomuraea africana]|uniref:Ribosomal protein S18 acetylase RimI-like enzyme n=1 Tax=Nonomuraea africana TaxID=46171 RepID=A0ABR9KU62_9ACTN|nr:N-acetyltransferase [Nonomuraea africana]MBE1565138.1 ribosomal protein S18 acetylase RimI-like enzyme [Nonomuraea africana]